MSGIKVSFLVFSYNQEKYIELAIRGALEQTYENIEFVFSDDCSPDSTFSLIVNTVQKYPGKNVRLIRNSQNLGLIRHVNKVLSQCTGDLIFMAAGDDISSPERVREVVECWQQGECKAGGIFTGLSLIDDAGTDLKTLNAKPVGNDVADEFCKDFSGVFGCSLAITKQVISVFGNIPEFALVEDRILAGRALLLGGILAVDIPLVKYRVHAGSISGNTVLLGKRDSLRGLLGFYRKQFDIDLGNIDAYLYDLAIKDDSSAFDEVRQGLILRKSGLVVDKLLYSKNIIERCLGVVNVFKHPGLQVTRKLKHFLFVFHPVLWLIVHRKYSLR